MDSILNRIRLPGLDIFQNLWVILGIAGGIVAIIALVVIVKILKRRRLRKAIKINLAGVEEGGERPEDNYESVIERVRRFGKKYKSILFASVELEALPVTVPVNVAIGLAKNKNRCLLIDVDLRRDSVAKVFELDGDKTELSPRAVETGFEGLWVWPGHNFAQLKQMNVKMIVQNAWKRFDFILINAPALTSSPDHRQIISAARAALICTKDASEATKLTELIKPLDCKVIGHIQITAGDEQG